MYAGRDYAGHYLILRKMEGKFIIAVVNHPVLNDRSLFIYRDTNRRSEAWREVAETVGGTGRFSPVWGVYIYILGLSS